MIEAKEINLNDIVIEDDANTRKTFKEKGLKELTANIKQHGVIEPIIVKPLPDGRFGLIAGERRLRASFMAGKITIPAIIKDVSEKEHLEINLIENLQREQLPYMEFAWGIRRLRDTGDYTVEEIARKVSKSVALIYNYLALTNTPEEVQEIFQSEEITAEVATIIATKLKDNHDYQTKAANALRRSAKDKRIQRRAAESYLVEHFGVASVVPKTKKLTKSDKNTSEYRSNWKKYLVRFDAEQFLEWRKWVAGRIDTETLAEAVENVMLNYERGRTTTV